MTDSGKRTRIASRTCIACSSAVPVRSRLVDRGDGHLDRQLDRVVGPGDALGRLHLLRELLHPGTELVGVAEEVEGAALHVPNVSRTATPRRGGECGFSRATCASSRGLASGRCAIGGRAGAGIGERRAGRAWRHWSPYRSLAAIAAVAAGGEVDAGRRARGLRSASRLACGPRLPDACQPSPAGAGLRLAAGPSRRAPSPRHRPPGPDPPACRWPRSTSAAAAGESCAVAAGPHLTASRPPHHRLHRDRRPPPLPRLGRNHLLGVPPDPRLGPSSYAAPTKAQIDAAAGVELLLSDDPARVPLETLPGRDHYEFPPGERPPWQWQIPGRYPGWSS